MSAFAAQDATAAGMAAVRKGDFAEAYCLWRPLADRGDPEAQYHVGWLYANGNGLAVDIERAIEFWRSAAEQGHADAQFAIGLAYTTGEGLGQDLDEAVDWYLRAARQGHPDAREILVRLNDGQNVELLDRHPELVTASWFGLPAVIIGDRINARAGPGTRHRVVAQLDKGMELRIIGRRDQWYMVVLANRPSESIAWIFESLLSKQNR